MVGRLLLLAIVLSKLSFGAVGGADVGLYSQTKPVFVPQIKVETSYLKRTTFLGLCAYGIKSMVVKPAIPPASYEYAVPDRFVSLDTTDKMLSAAPSVSQGHILEYAYLLEAKRVGNSFSEYLRQVAVVERLDYQESQRKLEKWEKRKRQHAIHRANWISGKFSHQWFSNWIPTFFDQGDVTVFLEGARIKSLEISSSVDLKNFKTFLENFKTIDKFKVHLGSSYEMKMRHVASATVNRDTLMLYYANASVQTLREYLEQFQTIETFDITPDRER